MITLGSVPPWLVLVMVFLAAVGLWATLWTIDRGLRRLWDWWRYDRVTPLLENGFCEDCWDGIRHCAGGETGCHCPCANEDVLELPPERSWEELGFTEKQPTVVYLPPVGREVEPTAGPPMWEYHRPERERQVPWWEAEIRSAYAALGLEGTGFTRAMAARVRELAP